ncbi:MAG TPA: AAA family ATPase, partial [Mycobacteriales bacterium]|nr:AAA family ATPase [Mycobacteriales bacterium]
MSRRGTHRLVGRAAELARLSALLDGAGRGEPALVLVGGDAGVGKTRILEEFATVARARGATVLVGGCVEVGDYGLPYVALIEALRAVEQLPGGDQLLRAAAASRPALGRLVPHLVDEQPAVPLAAPGDADETERLAQVQLFDAVLGLLVALGEQKTTGPVALILEDLHWADRSTRDLVAFLGRALRSGRVLLVASYRSDDLHRRHPLRPLLTELARRPDVERLDVRPFGLAESGELISALSGRRVDPATVQRVWERSEGNPFFTEEIVASGGCIDDPGGPLPTTLADVLLARVEQLSDESQQALRVASVAGRRVHHRLLAAALGSDPVDVESLLREPVQRQLLVTDGDTYAFRHALLQEAVYGDLLPGERVRTHATFARLLAEDDAGPGEPRLGRAAELAHHMLASHDLPQALKALVQAAGEAEKVAAPAEALRHIDQALAILDRVPEVGADRWALLLRAAAAAAASGDPMRAISLAREATQLPGIEALRCAEAHERLAHLMLEGDQCGPESMASARRAVELAPVEPPTRVRAKAIAVLARVLANTRDDDECEQMCTLGEEVAAAAGAADVAADLIATRAVLASRRGMHQDVEQHAAAVAAAEAAGGVEVRLRAIRNYGWALYDVNDIPKAIATYDEGIALAQRSGLLLSSYGTELLGQLVSVLVLAGQWDEALARASIVRGSDISATTWVDASVASVLLRRGDPAAAAALQALRIRGMDDTYVGAELRAWSAVLAAEQGDTERARQELADALRQSSRWHWQGDLLLVHRVGAEIEADIAVRAASAEDRAAAAVNARGHAASAA